ncbi:MAG: magnesium transporter [Planctomycetota bacterium]
MNTTPPRKSAPRDKDLLDVVRQCLESGDIDGVKELLDGVRPADVASVLGDLDDEMLASVFRLLDAETGAEVLDELGPDDVQALAQAAPNRVRDAVGEMEPDEAVDVLEQATAAEQLLPYPPDTAGGLMTTEFVSLPKDVTAREAIEITQRSREAETVGHLFVADQDSRLVGHLPLQALVFAPPDRLVGDLIEDYPHTVTADTDQEELVRAATRYDLAAVPVVDRERRLIGVVTLDDILEAAEKEVDEDMYRLAGTGERDPVHASVYRSTTLRLPWLLLSVLDGLFIAYVLSHFKLVKEPKLLYFIPLIPLMGGQVAIQASTIMVRGLALGSIRRSMLARFLARQFVITLMLSLCCSGATGVLGWLLVPDVTARVMLAVGLAVCAAILIAGMLGMTLPLAFNMVGIDPAVSAGPFITMLNDLICIFIYTVLGTLLVA